MVRNTCTSWESRNGLTNLRGTVAMARTMVPDSATAQFFINVRDNPFLAAANAWAGTGYAVFGQVVAGLEVVGRSMARSLYSPSGSAPILGCGTAVTQWG